EFATTGGIPAGLAFHRDGTLYCADEGERIHGVIRLDAQGVITPFVDHFAGRPLNGANDLVFDRLGVLYFSDPWGSSGDHPIGAFYRAFPDGRLEQLDSGLAFPNGVALDAAESAVFLAETPRNHILRYPISSDGAVGRPTVFARLRGQPGPDGMAFDRAGNLYVAQHGAGRVIVLDPAGRELDAIAVPGSRPTNVAFAGPDFAALVVTEVQTAGVYRLNLGVPGQPLFGVAFHR
ncbi:MAG TPA: SMP-30/gluconolactonase/LRE family protein, partial [Chloroflexota bacterium]|nr:SMP-30/gluconolactonase/LRE family protein [Chloroflexota bacterium]